MTRNHYQDILWHLKIQSASSPASRHIHKSVLTLWLPPYLPSMIPPSLPLWVHLSIHLPVLATRSHLVAQQHDDHVLLGVLMDLCQPCLQTEIKRAHVSGEVEKSRTGKEIRERREYRGNRHDTKDGLEIDHGDRGDGWSHREGEREKDKRFIYCSLAAVHLVHPSSLQISSSPFFSPPASLSINLLPITGQ